MTSKVKIGKNDRLLLRLHTGEVYEGDVEFLSTTCVELANIFCHSSQQWLENTYVFYRTEVERYSKIKDIDDDKQSSSSGVSSGSSSDLSLKDDTLEVPQIDLPAREYDRLRELSIHSIYVTPFDKYYYDAINSFSNSESVALAGLGIFDQNISLLVMCDFKQIYLFDLTVEMNDLKKVLESTFIAKVVHDGAELYDSLYHKYGIEMKNIFDTQVCDNMLDNREGNREVIRNLGQCLNHHFNFPLSLLASAMENTHYEYWRERPLPKVKSGIAALHVTYLLTLRDHLRSILLKDFTDATLEIYSECKNTSDLHMIEKMGKLDLCSQTP